MLAHEDPEVARRLATWFLMLSSTVSLGRMYFSSEALLFPIVVSMDTCVLGGNGLTNVRTDLRNINYVWIE